MRGGGDNTGRDATGFTLVELLVVIAVIMLMLSTLLPALGGARDTTRRVVCLSNQRQLGVAFHAYAAGQRELLPNIAWQVPGGGWTQWLQNGNQAPENWRTAMAVNLRRNFLNDTLNAFACPSRLISTDDRYDESVWQASWAADTGYPDSIRRTCYEATTTWFMNPSKNPGYQAGNANFETVRTQEDRASDKPLIVDRVHWAGYANLWGANHTVSGRNLLYPEQVDAITGGNVLNLDGSGRWKRFDRMSLNYWWNSPGHAAMYW